jgi:hypothetical protein
MRQHTHGIYEKTSVNAMETKQCASGTLPNSSHEITIEDDVKVTKKLLIEHDVYVFVTKKQDANPT